MKTELLKALLLCAGVLAFHVGFGEKKNSKFIEVLYIGLGWLVTR